jgi:hypothetical protein
MFGSGIETSDDARVWKISSDGLQSQYGETGEIRLQRRDGSTAAYVVPPNYRDQYVKRMFQGLDMNGHLMVGAAGGLAIGAIGVWALTRRR